MTEQQWRTSTDSLEMLKNLPSTVSLRKRLLFGAACCRRLWQLLPDERSQRAVEVTERYADGLASAEELQTARANAEAARERWLEHYRQTRAESEFERAAMAAMFLASKRPILGAEMVAHAAAAAAGTTARAGARLQVVSEWGTSLAAVPPELAPATWQALSLPAWFAVQAEEAQENQARAACHAAARRHQSDLLREIVGNPFRPPKLDAGCLSPACRGIARAVHEEGSYEQLPILADALEEAGCRDANVLTHLRSAGPHVRGCWALDAVLQKA
jgi:hypothetical protein